MRQRNVGSPIQTPNHNGASSIKEALLFVAASFGARITGALIFGLVALLAAPAAEADGEHS